MLWRVFTLSSLQFFINVLSAQSHLKLRCTWILTMLFRASGSLEPTLLCEWMGGDLLWALAA